MKRIILAALAMLALATVAGAGTYPDLNSSTSPGVAPIPFPYQPLCPGSHAVSLATATTLQAGSMLPTGMPNAARSCITQTVISVRYCVVVAATAPVYYTLDGSTTASASDESISVGGFLALVGPAEIAAADFYSATGTLHVECAQ